MKKFSVQVLYHPHISPNLMQISLELLSNQNSNCQTGKINSPYRSY